MEFAINPEYDDVTKCWTASAEGEIDIFKSSEFKNELIALIDDKPGSLILDCRKLEYIDSTGLGALVAVLKRVKSNGGSITLRELKHNIVKLFKITNLDKVFIIEGDDCGE